MNLITDKQANLIRTLSADRAIAVDIDTLPTLTRREASNMISTLFATPAVKDQVKALATPGYYILADDSLIVIVENRAKTGTYAKKLTITESFDGRKTAKWVYTPGKSRAMAGMTPLSVTEAARLGHRFGICVVCAKTLTTPKSVAAGIGPICAKRLA